VILPVGRAPLHAGSNVGAMPLSMKGMMHVSHLRRVVRIVGPVLLSGLAAGCASKSFEDEVIYRDQRLVTTRPAADDDSEPDVLVRVERFDIPRGSLAAKDTPPAVADLPADATLGLAAESLASYDVPFYATAERPRGRVEIGGKVRKPGDDAMLRTQIDFGEGGPGTVNSVSSIAMLRPGETFVLSSMSEGAPPKWVRSVTVLRVAPYRRAK